MKLTEFKPSISQQVRSEIEHQLSRVEQENKIEVLFAIESGSRAWGFPSPDSDYDVRFVYMHDLDWYLSLKPERDVIELPISDELDICGWDLRKALNLLLKPNPVLLEWLSSPIRYRWNDYACTRISQLAKHTAHLTACRYHYLNQARGPWERYILENPEPPLKKFFYVLRPALCLRWMRDLPATRPPMNLQALVNGLDLSDDIVSAIDGLIQQKAKLLESEAWEPPRVLVEFITSEFEFANDIPSNVQQLDLRKQADELFRELVKNNEDQLHT